MEDTSLAMDGTHRSLAYNVVELLYMSSKSNYYKMEQPAARWQLSPPRHRCTTELVDRFHLRLFIFYLIVENGTPSAAPDHAILERIVVGSCCLLNPMQLDFGWHC